MAERVAATAGRVPYQRDTVPKPLTFGRSRDMPRVALSPLSDLLCGVTSREA
jgi:hypothetical protein